MRWHVPACGGYLRKPEPAPLEAKLLTLLLPSPVALEVRSILAMMLQAALNEGTTQHRSACWEHRCLRSSMTGDGGYVRMDGCGLAGAQPAASGVLPEQRTHPGRQQARAV